MFKSRKILWQVLMVTAFLCSCGQNEESGTDGNGAGDGGDVSVVFRLESNSSTATRGVEDSYEHLQGTAAEYKVNSVRVYLFDSATKLFAKSFALSGITYAGTDRDGNIIYDTDPVSLAPGKYDIFATANSNRQIDKKNEDEFLADIDSQTYSQALIDDVSGGILMTNRATDNLNTDIIKNSESDVNMVNISLERVLARLDIAKAADAFEVTDSKGACCTWHSGGA